MVTNAATPAERRAAREVAHGILRVMGQPCGETKAGTDHGGGWKSVIDIPHCLDCDRVTAFVDRACSERDAEVERLRASLLECMDKLETSVAEGAQLRERLERALAGCKAAEAVAKELLSERDRERARAEAAEVDRDTWRAKVKKWMVSEAIDVRMTACDIVNENASVCTDENHAPVCDSATAQIGALLAKASRPTPAGTAPRGALLGCAEVAKRFHETYERLAPSYGWKTQAASAVPWDSLPANQRELMVHVVHVVLGLCDEAAARHLSQGTPSDLSRIAKGECETWCGTPDPLSVGLPRAIRRCSKCTAPAVEAGPSERKTWLDFGGREWRGHWCVGSKCEVSNCPAAEHPGTQSGGGEARERDYEVTVCAECLTASCWHGEFMCEKSKGAGTTQRAASVLDRLGKEHPDNYSIEKLVRATGAEPRFLVGAWRDDGSVNCSCPFPRTKCPNCGHGCRACRLSAQPGVREERDDERPTCDTPGCGKPIPVGGEGDPEICPDCLRAERDRECSEPPPSPTAGTGETPRDWAGEAVDLLRFVIRKLYPAIHLPNCTCALCAFVTAYDGAHPQAGAPKTTEGR